VTTQETTAETAEDMDRRVPPLTRVVVYALLAAMVLAAMFRVEWWPITSWRLFSGVRGPIVYTWQVTDVDADGHEERLDFGVLPRAYSGWYHIVQTFPHVSVGERAAVCETWLAAVRATGVPAVAVRVYFAHHDTRTDFDAPPPPTIRRVYFRCGTDPAAP
jgi:hypothetical protein